MIADLVTAKKDDLFAAAQSAITCEPRAWKK